MVELTSLERAVLFALAEQLPSPERECLALQIAEASVTTRENTGVGFYTNFEAGSSPKCSTLTDLRNCDFKAEVEGIEHGMGFILWVDDGRIDCLEGYTYEGSTAGFDLAAIKFELIA